MIYLSSMEEKKLTLIACGTRQNGDRRKQQCVVRHVYSNSKYFSLHV